MSTHETDHRGSADIDEFIAKRQRLNEIVLDKGTLVTKRFFNLDGQGYKAGALDEKTKELMGLVASLVLRCNDCILYHILQAKKCGASTSEFTEACDIALIVGGSIVIPHLREAYGHWESLRQSPENGDGRE
jgi:AhpD family alkylhydroperoxidase